MRFSSLKHHTSKHPSLMFISGKGSTSQGQNCRLEHASVSLVGRQGAGCVPHCLRTPNHQDLPGAGHSCHLHCDLWQRGLQGLSTAPPALLLVVCPAEIRTQTQTCAHACNHTHARAHKTTCMQIRTGARAKHMRRNTSANVCEHTCVHTYMNTHACIQTHATTRAHLCSHRDVHMYTWLHARPRVHRTCTQIYMCACVPTHIYNTCTYMHIYTDTCTNIQARSDNKYTRAHKYTGTEHVHTMPTCIKTHPGSSHTQGCSQEHHVRSQVPVHRVCDPGLSLPGNNGNTALPVRPWRLLSADMERCQHRCRKLPKKQGAETPLKLPPRSSWAPGSLEVSSARYPRSPWAPERVTRRR